MTGPWLPRAPGAGAVVSLPAPLSLNVGAIKAAVNCAALIPHVSTFELPAIAEAAFLIEASGVEPYVTPPVPALARPVPAGLRHIVDWYWCD